MTVSQARRGHGQQHPSLVALLNECTAASDAEAAVRIRARELVTQARELGWAGPPFDPVLLAEIRGIKVRPSSHELRQDAFVRRDEGGQVEIVWNQNRPTTRTRFSIGHEITHTFFPDCFVTVRNRECTAGSEESKDALERLCDVGAAELLMPLLEFTNDLRSLGVNMEAVDALRDRYQVSRQAACIRAVQLTEHPCAAAFLSHRIKPTEERRLAQGAFSFFDRPGPKLRVDFMVASRTFRGRTLPRHKSIPVGSRVSGLAKAPSSVDAAVEAVEEWPDVMTEPLRVVAARVPGSRSDDVRVLALLKMGR